MSYIELINFINLNLDEKKMLLSWRNNHNIRKWMHNKNEISMDEHLSYIESLEEKNDRIYFLVKQEGVTIGIIDFTSINKVSNSAEIGLYSNPDIKGVGTILMQEIVKYGFDNLKLKKLIANVFLENTKAISLYKKYNFKELKVDKDLLYMELNSENR
jgi:UDP-4-amino-4,6-dideoxy-N-acetyl-beta-L-altrosamine N-acetyltransferase